MEESQYVIYEECASPLGIQRNAGPKINISSDNFQTNTLASTYIASAPNLPNSILTKSSSLPITHFIKEGVHTLSQAEILDPKNDSASRISSLPQNLINSSDLSLQGDKVLSEDNRIKVGNELIAANSYYTPTENGSTSYRLLLASLPLVKNSLSDKNLNETLLTGNQATPGEASTVPLTLDNQAKGHQWESDGSPLIVNTSSVIKCKKDSSNSQVVVKLMQDDLNYDMVEIISPSLENSHVFELIDKNNELTKTPLSKDINNEVSSGNLRLISVSDDVKGNVSPTSNLLYTCCFCNKFFLSDMACNEHAKVCLPYSSTDSTTRDSQLNEGDLFFDIKNTSVSNNKKCLKSNLVWICMICSQEFSKPLNLKIHYISHSLEELSTTLMKCTLPSLPKVEKSNSMNQFTINEKLNPNIPKLGDSTVGKLPTMLDVKKESISLKTGKDISTLVDSDRVFNSPQSLVPKSTSDDSSFLKTKQYSKIKKAKTTTKGKVKSSINGSGLKSRDPHACPVCKKFLSSRGNLAKHLIQHETVKPWVCKVCGSGFNSKRNHDYHYMQRHTTLRPSVCTICGKGYTNKGTLSEHMIFHKKEKDFKCLLCGKGFRTKKCMNRHMQRHESSRKFVCNLCFKAFRVNVDLVSHLKLVHSSEHRKNKPRSLKSQSSTQISQDSVYQFLDNDSTSQKNIKKKTLNLKNVESEQISSVKEQMQQTSNCDHLNKIKDFSDLLESPTNPILPNINEFPVESLTQNRLDPLVNGENIETPTIIPISSANERHIYNNTYDLTLQNKHSVTNADLSSSTFVIIGVAENQTGVESNYEKGTWNNLTEYKSVYQDIASKEPNGTPNVTEIGLLPTVLENIPQSYLDSVDEGVATADNSILTKPLKRTLSIEKTLVEKELESNFGENKVAEGPKEEILTNDTQTQTLNLDLLSQTLHLDFHSTHGSNTATFL